MSGSKETPSLPLEKVRDGGTVSVPDRSKFLNVRAVYENTNHPGEPAESSLKSCHKQFSESMSYSVPSRGSDATGVSV